MRDIHDEAQRLAAQINELILATWALLPVLDEKESRVSDELENSGLGVHQGAVLCGEPDRRRHAIKTVNREGQRTHVCFRF
jgi:alkanesulfonate monooxygenase SsuD/methylene tetrahydromethanopterin reductase-like flavin-dependent oxidoreductase (luciferase family)